MSYTFSDFNTMLETVTDDLFGAARLNRVELGDAYNLEQNPAMSLRNGWGYQIGSGNFSGSSPYKQTHIDQEFSITLTENGAIHSKGSATRAAITKLHTQATEVIKELQQPNHWQPGIVLISLEPIENIFIDDTSSFFTLKINFSVKLIDDI